MSEPICALHVNRAHLCAEPGCGWISSTERCVKCSSETILLAPVLNRGEVKDEAERE